MGQGKATIGDLIAEAVGALSLAAGMGFSGWVVAAPLGFDPSLIGSGAAFIGLLVGWAVIRAVPVAVVLPDLSIALAPIESVAPGPSTGEDEGELLLDTPIFVPHGDTCVVRLFGADRPLTAGELQAQIDAYRREAGALPRAASPALWDGPQTITDARDALHAALNELRRSLRRQ